MKKLMILIVAFAMVLAMSVPSFATSEKGNPTDGTKIHGLSKLGETITVYYGDPEIGVVFHAQGNHYEYEADHIKDMGGQVRIIVADGTEYTATLTWRANQGKGTENYDATDLKEVKPVQPIYYSIIYDGNAGVDEVKGLPATEGGKEDGKNYDLSKEIPTREDYEFLGWGAERGSASSITNVTINGANVTVYAIWKAEEEEPAQLFTLEYFENKPLTAEGDVSGMPSPTKVENLDVGAHSLSNSKPVLEGYEFKGWAISASIEGDSQLIDQIEIVDQNVTVYAIWQPKLVEEVKTVKVIYNANIPREALGNDLSGLLNPVDVEINYGAYSLTDQGPTLVGYEFKGWALSADSKTPVNLVTINETDVTVYAIWEKKQSTVIIPNPPEPPVVNPPEEDDDPGNSDSPEPPVVNPPEEDDDPGNFDSPEPTTKPGEDTEKEDNKATNPSQPKTDDSSNLQLYALMTLGAMGGLYVVWRKKENRE